MPEFTIQHIMPCRNLSDPLEVDMLPGQMVSPVSLVVEASMASAEISAELICPLWTPTFHRKHDYNPKKHNLIEGWANVWSPDMKPGRLWNTRTIRCSIHWWLQKKRESGVAAVIDRNFQNGETTCGQLSKRLPDNCAILTVDVTAISTSGTWVHFIAM